jgi:hypothetical protein
MSRLFPCWNASGPPCPICGTQNQEPAILVPIPGTESDGVVECRQMHERCGEIVAKSWLEARRREAAVTP